MIGGASVASPKTINGSNFYVPSLNNVEIGDGTTQTFTNISAGLFRITGYFKINSNAWFANGSQVIVMHDILNNTVPTLTMAANSYISVYNRSNGFAGVANTSGTYSSNPTFYFGFTTSGGNYTYPALSSVVTLDKTSTVIDSISSTASTTQSTIVNGPLSYGNLTIYHNLSSGTGAVSFAGGQTITVRGTLNVQSSLGTGVTLNSATLIMAPGAQLNIASGAALTLTKDRLYCRQMLQVQLQLILCQMEQPILPTTLPWLFNNIFLPVKEHTDF